MTYTLDDELKFEAEQFKRAQELFHFKINKELEAQQAPRTPMGRGMIKLMSEQYFRNVLAWLTEEIKPKRGVRKIYKNMLEAYVKLVGEDTLALTLVATTLPILVTQACGRRIQSISTLSRIVGSRIHEAMQFEAFAQEHPELLKQVQENYNKRVDAYKKYYYLQDNYKKLELKFYKPSIKERIALGYVLINILCDSTNLFEIHTSGGDKGNTFVAPTDKFIEVWDENLVYMCNSLRLRCPTIIPPKPWESLDDGAYWGTNGRPTPFLRQNFLTSKTRIYKDYLRKLKEVDLSEVMGAINKIQETAYKINKEVLAVIQEIIKSGGDLAGIPALEPEPEIPLLEGEHTKAELKAHKNKYVERIYREQKRKIKAFRALNIISTADSLANYETIYFPCNIDFRGRVYPVSLFSHQGDDLMKSLILYAKPEPTKTNDDWKLLLIQGCNLYGNDKISLEDRVKFIEDNSHKILASAESPFENRYWLEADDPLQFLAFCYEYKKALAYKKEHNGSFIGYECGIVIAYDGTCSGLQHYSAMLLDEVGGSAVNLIDHEVPSDIYQKVADKVLPLVEKDAQEGTPDEPREDGGVKAGTKTIAQAWLSYGITRKVCKRPVMTLAYGSGQYGFKSQLFEDICKDNPIFKGMENYASLYLAQLIWQAVQSVVVSATAGMKYLKDLAGVLTKHNLPVNWWTPLGLPVQQQYLKTNMEMFRTRLGDKMSMPLYYEEIDRSERVKKSKQKNGVAPNFIHSLDATHLMMTVNSANLRNYTTIHDSFGTSLGEASHLKVVIRQQMYKLYTEHKPLEAFKQYVEECTGEDTSEIEEPKKGSLDLKGILTSKYVFH